MPSSLLLSSLLSAAILVQPHTDPHPLHHSFVVILVTSLLPPLLLLSPKGLWQVIIAVWYKNLKDGKVQFTHCLVRFIWQPPDGQMARQIMEFPIVEFSAEMGFKT